MAITDCPTLQMASPPPIRTRKKSVADSAVAPSIRRRREHEKRVVALFKAIDADGDGFLEKRELSRGLRNPTALRLINEEAALQPLLDPMHWEKTFYEMDGGEATDGRVTFTEFRKFCMDVVGDNDDGVSHDTDTPTNEQAIHLLQVPGADRTEEHVDALLLWSRTNEAMDKLLQPLPIDLLREVIRAFRYKKIQPGEFVCEQGDIGSLFYVILKGTIDFYVRGKLEQKTEMSMRTAGGLGTEKPTSHTLLVEQRLGKKVASFSAGSGFGELALLGPAGSTRRSASCLCPMTPNVNGSPPDPCHLVTLERTVYYRLFRATQQAGSDIGAKVRTIQDSCAFTWWPRGHVIRFAMGLKTIKISKNGVLCSAGDSANKLFLIASGEVEESQPITLSTSATGMPSIVYPWSTTTQHSNENRMNRKIVVDLGRYVPLDYVAALPTLLDLPFYFTTVKAVTPVTVVVISRTYFNMFLRPPPVAPVSSVAAGRSGKEGGGGGGNSMETAEKIPVFYQKTIKSMAKQVKLREVMRKQRVRAALAAPDVTIKMTTAMTRAFTCCGRCGRKGHAWGEENDYGMLKCPLGQGVGKRAKSRKSITESAGDFGGRTSRPNGGRRNGRRSTKKRNGGSSRGGGLHVDLDDNQSRRGMSSRLMGSQRWSVRQSKRMRGGTPCTVASLSSLLNRFEIQDKQDAMADPTAVHRPSTSMGHSARTPPSRSGLRSQVAASSSQQQHARPHTSMCVATPPKTAPSKVTRSHFTSPNLKKRSQKVLQMLKLHKSGADEFQFSFRAKRVEYVMADEIDFENEGYRYEKEERERAHFRERTFVVADGNTVQDVKDLLQEHETEALQQTKIKINRHSGHRHSAASIKFE